MHYARFLKYADPLILKQRIICNNYIKDGVGYIELTKGKYALVSLEDFEKFKTMRWCFSGCGYAITTINSKIQYMHRLLVKSNKGMVTDHINRNRLDNRRDNLRTVTYSQNVKNADRFQKPLAE